MRKQNKPNQINSLLVCKKSINQTFKANLNQREGEAAPFGAASMEGPAA